MSPVVSCKSVVDYQYIGIACDAHFNRMEFRSGKIRYLLRREVTGLAALGFADSVLANSGEALPCLREGGERLNRIAACFSSWPSLPVVQYLPGLEQLPWRSGSTRGCVRRGSSRRLLSSQ